MALSRLNYGRDAESKHGVSAGKSRLGGLALIFSLFSGIILNNHLNNTLSEEVIWSFFNGVLIFSILIGLVGFIEDINQNLGSLTRLFLIIFIIFISLNFMPELIPRDLPIFDIFEPKNRLIAEYIFAVIMISGFVNAGNIADGANGLLSLIYLIFFFLLYSIEPSILSLSMIVSLLTFFIYNISTGKIFLGDLGAYFLSALVAFSCLNAYKNNDISIFLFGSILVYPCFEITRSLILRFIKKTSVFSPDNNHLHNHLNNYFLIKGFSSHVANSMTGVTIASLSSGVTLGFFIYGIKLPSDNWIYLLIAQLIMLIILYAILSKINLKKV